MSHTSDNFYVRKLVKVTLKVGQNRKLQSWKLICRLLKLFRNFAPPPHTMLNCGPVSNVVSNIVLREGEGALLLVIVGPCTG